MFSLSSAVWIVKWRSKVRGSTLAMRAPSDDQLFFGESPGRRRTTKRDACLSARRRFVARQRVGVYTEAPCERVVAALRRAFTSPGNPKSFQPWITRAKPVKRRSPNTGSPGARNQKTPATPKYVSHTAFTESSLLFAFAILFSIEVVIIFSRI